MDFLFDFENARILHPFSSTLVPVETWPTEPCSLHLVVEGLFVCPRFAGAKPLAVAHQDRKVAFDCRAIPHLPSLHKRTGIENVHCLRQPNTLDPAYPPSAMIL